MTDFSGVPSAGAMLHGEHERMQRKDAKLFALWDIFKHPELQEIFHLMPKRGVVGDHCRNNPNTGRWEHVMLRRVHQGGRA